LGLSFSQIESKGRDRDRSRERWSMLAGSIGGMLTATHQSMD
jgi:hypothetical protein